jgi:hypothetical protein
VFDIGYLGVENNFSEQLLYRIHTKPEEEKPTKELSQE